MKMKTNSAEFDMMVGFMEKNGDLNKLPEDSYSRLHILKLWETLKEMLNNYGMGEPKSTAKWRKVWSDLKNNTKRKARRIHQAASSNGRSEIRAELTDLEQRVLNIIRSHNTSSRTVEVADDLKFSVVGVPQEVNAFAEVSCDYQFKQSPVSVEVVSPQHTGEISSHTAPSNERLSSIFEEDFEESVQSNPSPTPAAKQTSCRRLLSAQDRRRAHLKRAHTSLKRRGRTTEDFLNSDREWRNIAIETQRQQAETKREELRIREMELQVQQRWQDLFGNVVQIMDKVVDKFCK